MARIAAGDRAAEHEMYERYARAVILILRQRGADKELAEDICQETFLTACVKLRPAQDPENVTGIRKSESLASYLQGIAINKLGGERRKVARQDTRADTEAIERAVANIEGPFEDAATEQIRQTIKIALGNLAVPRDRDILVSVYLHDEDRASIQRRLGIDADHLNRVLYRAKQRLAAEVASLLAKRGAAAVDMRDFAAKRHY